jgi:hypothetical protein
VVFGQVCAVWTGADGRVCRVYGLSHEAEGSVLGSCEVRLVKREGGLGKVMRHFSFLEDGVHARTLLGQSRLGRKGPLEMPCAQLYSVNITNLDCSIRWI